ncbi:hypothetical protein DXG03_006048, partial [Asterophora parasitica]
SPRYAHANINKPVSQPLDETKVQEKEADPPSLFVFYYHHHTTHSLRASMPKAAKAPKAPKRLHSEATPTGIRRFFFKLELLGKRCTNLAYDYSNLSPVVKTPPADDKHSHPSYPRIPSSALGKENQNPVPSPAVPPAFNHPQGSPQHTERVALINEDHSEQAVVVTTLDNVPFCCHEDLLTMPRESLLGVARSLNARLPHVMAIDIDHVLPTSFIRSCIERLVGLRADVPHAPKALRLLTDSKSDQRLIAEWRRRQISNTPPTSPLARRSQSHGQLTSLMSPRLARLAEEDEGGDVDMDVADSRLQKKRKLSFNRAGNDDETEEDSDVDIFFSPQQSSPTPLQRAPMQRMRSHYVAPKTRISPAPVRVLRSQSQQIARATTTDVRDTAFMHEKQPVARYQRRTIRSASGNTKIPKPIGAPRKNERLRTIAANDTQRSGAPGVDTRRVTESNASFSPRMSGASSTLFVVTGAKRKRGGTEPEKQVTSGMRKMSMGGYGVESDAMDTGS